MWIADKIAYRGEENFVRAYQGTEIVWQKSIPNNTIYYTSSDGQVINVTGNSSYWGANIVSNTYTDGQGIITFDGQVTKIGRDRFYGQSRLTSINLPSGVTMIDNTAFTKCSSLRSIDLSYVTSFGNYIFDDCTSLSSVILNSSLTSLPVGLFLDCTGLTSVTIPSGVTSLGNEVFRHSGLISVTIPSGVTSIGNLAFFNCHSLVEVRVNAVTPPSLGSNVFVSDVAGRLIKVPSGSVQAYKTAPGWSDYASSIVAQ